VAGTIGQEEEADKRMRNPTAEMGTGISEESMMYNQLLLHEMTDAINRSRRMADAALAGSLPRSYGVAGTMGQTGTSWIVKTRAWLGRLLTRDTAPRPEPVVNQ
jgi:hypothetical protein